MSTDRGAPAPCGAPSSDDPRVVYDAWAPRYDAENLAMGFRLPFVAASFLARHLPPARGTVLDAACGTGLVGEHLDILGYTLVGCDLSPEMLCRAAATRAYTALELADLTALPFTSNYFAGFIASGATGPGHAPPEALGELARVTRPGGIGVFSLREDTSEAQGFAAMARRMSETGRWRELVRTDPFRAYLTGEPHLFSRLVIVEVTG